MSLDDLSKKQIESIQRMITIAIFVILLVWVYEQAITAYVWRL